MMPLEQQVCSLDPSRRLKDLGVKQESYWYWGVDGLSKTYELFHPWNDKPLEGTSVAAAFSVAELGEILKNQNSRMPRYDCGDLMNAPKWFWFYESFEKVSNVFTADTEADARAKMLIYLIENGLVKPFDL